MKIGDNIKVLDSETNELLLSGKITKVTNNPIGYSIDGQVFFNPNSKKFNFEFFDNALAQIYSTKTESDKYIRYNHNNIDNTFEYDFFMWNEIEPEVRETVDLLNELDFIETYSSCSGHGKIPAYIDFHILNYDKFFSFLHFLNKYNLKSYCSKHGELEEDYKFRFIVGVEGKNTCHLELVEIDSNFDKLNDFIKKYIKIEEFMFDNQ